MSAMSGGWEEPPNDDAEFEAAEHRRAMGIIQKVVNARRARKALLAAVDRARETFMDKEAIKAGAENGRFYSTIALIVRDGLRSNELVVAALGVAWRCVLAAAEAEQIGQRGSLAHESYAKMIRKLYLYVHEVTGDTAIDPQDCLSAVEEDWPRDAEMNAATGQLHLTELAFHRSWFELADLYVRGVSATDYANWIEGAARRITTLRCKPDLHRSTSRDNFDYSGVRWRDDAPLLDHLTRRVPMPSPSKIKGLPQPPLEAQYRKAIFRPHRKRWETAFADRAEAGGVFRRPDVATSDASPLSRLKTSVQTLRALQAVACFSPSRAPPLDSDAERRLNHLRRPTAAQALGRFECRAVYRSSPVLVARAPIVNVHRRAPTLPASIKTGVGMMAASASTDGWMVVASVDHQMVGARRPLVTPPGKRGVAAEGAKGGAPGASSAPAAATFRGGGSKRCMASSKSAPVLALAAVPKSAPTAVGFSSSVSKVANLYRSQRLAVY